jgi:hypothetical protein
VSQVQAVDLDGEIVQVEFEAVHEESDDEDDEEVRFHILGMHRISSLFGYLYPIRYRYGSWPAVFRIRDVFLSRI